jgi:hypothetical protein
MTPLPPTSRLHPAVDKINLPISHLKNAKNPCYTIENNTSIKEVVSTKIKIKSRIKIGYTGTCRHIRRRIR